MSNFLTHGACARGDIRPRTIDRVLVERVGVTVEVNTESALLKQSCEILHINLIDRVVTHHDQPVVAGDAVERGLEPIILHAAALRHNVLVEHARALEVVVRRVHLKTNDK